MNTMYILLSILSGFLSGLSFYNASFSFFIWASLCPFLFVIGKAKMPQIIGYSFVCGLTYFLTVLFWVGYVTRLGLFLLVFYLSLYWILFGCGAAFLARRPNKILTIPFLWIVLEFLREHIWVGFGWAILGYSQHTHPLIVQSADIFGVKFISWIIVMGNVALLEVLKKRRIFARETYVFCVILLISTFYSVCRLHTLKEKDFFKISLIQTNIPQQLKWDPRHAEVIREKLIRLGKESPEDSLLVYPEASYPFIVEKGMQEAEKFFAPMKKDVLIGAIEEEDRLFYNSAILINARGERVARYRKIKLVPFGEYVPLRKYVSFIDVINMMGDISPGEKKEVFSCKGKKFSVLVCFEDLIPSLTTSFSRNADFLVNITNDAWFYGQPQTYQHFGVMSLRAVENRISIARCANTGISGWVSFKGESSIFEKEGKKNFIEGVYATKMPINEKRSFYAMFPELFVYLGMISLPILVFRKIV